MNNNMNMNNLFMNMNNNMNNNMMINNQFMVHPNSEMIINLLNQNNEMMNQIAINNNMIIQMMNNPMSNNTNNIINNNIQFNNNIDILPRKNDYLNSEDYFPGNKNIRCNIHFKLNSGKKIISTPKDIKVKDLLLTFAKIFNSFFKCSKFVIFSSNNYFSFSLFAQI